MARMRRTFAVLALCLAGGCATSPSPSAGSNVPAAEPETAPSTGAPPAGHVVRVGAKPEGLAVDAQTRVVAVAVHDPAMLVLLDGGSVAELRRPVASWRRALRALVRDTPGSPRLRSPTLLPTWGGAALLLGYGAAFATAATVTTNRRDVR